MRRQRVDRAVATAGDGIIARLRHRTEEAVAEAAIDGEGAGRTQGQHRDFTIVAQIMQIDSWIGRGRVLHQRHVAGAAQLDARHQVESRIGGERSDPRLDGARIGHIGLRRRVSGHKRLIDERIGGDIGDRYRLDIDLACAGHGDSVVGNADTIGSDPRRTNGNLAAGDIDPGARSERHPPAGNGIADAGAKEHAGCVAARRGRVRVEFGSPADRQGFAEAGRQADDAAVAARGVDQASDREVAGHSRQFDIVGRHIADRDVAAAQGQRLPFTEARDGREQRTGVAGAEVERYLGALVAIDAAGVESAIECRGAVARNDVKRAGIAALVRRQRIDARGRRQSGTADIDGRGGLHVDIAVLRGQVHGPGRRDPYHVEECCGPARNVDRRTGVQRHAGTAGQIDHARGDFDVGILLDGLADHGEMRAK